MLYLIKRQNIDVLDIPIAQITHQYMEYVEIMKSLRLELAAEYLVMAAMLAEIKSRMLLPRPSLDEEGEEDPRAELIRRLQEYERYKQAAEDINELPRQERDHFQAQLESEERKVVRLQPEVSLAEVLYAFREVLRRADMFTHHHIEREPLSVRERMSNVLNLLQVDQFTSFTSLFTLEEGRRGAVVTLLAVLELVKEKMIELIQADAFAQIHVKIAGGPQEVAAAEMEEETEQR